jgi:hypothetical protein
VARVIRYIDLAVLLVALPVFIAADLPLLGYVAGAGAYLLQRALQIATRRRADRSDDPKTVAGIMAGSLIGRGWLVALIIFGVGIASDDETGLSAAVLFIATFTVYLTVNMILRPFDEADRKGAL